MDTKDDLVLESAVTQISTNSVEAARNLSAVVAGKSKKRVCDEDFIIPVERTKRQCTKLCSVTPEVMKEGSCSTVITTSNCRQDQKGQVNLEYLQEHQFLETLRRLLSASEKLEEPAFKFDVSDEAADFNMKLIKDNNFDLDRLLNEKASVTRYGSEFKSTQDLDPLLVHHPRWQDMKD